MKKYILALDQGTTSSRSIIFDKQGNIVAIAQQEFTQFFPEPGWVEHDAEEIWQTQLQTIQQVLNKANIKAPEIAAIGITNQRETTVVWNKNTGKPISRAIVWQDRRTANFCDDLRERKLDKLIQQKTGLIVDAYFSATKINWILNHVPDALIQAKNGELCFGTMDTWLLWKLTHRKIHATDVTNASRTMLCNIHTCQWDNDLLEIFGIPTAILPNIKSSSEVYGYTTCIDGFTEIAIAGIAGDQQAALFGQLCTTEGMVKNTYGTGCFMLMNTGTKPIISNHNLLTTIAWKINDTVTYALEGSVFIAGAVVQWLRDGLGIIKTSADVEELANKTNNNEGVYFVPAFAGLGTPYWNQYAKGTIVGLTRGSTAAHIARAALESIAYQTMDVLNAMNADSNIYIRELRVDGGATKNNLLMQFQSNILNTKVIRPTNTETTALGAAYLAGLAVGFWNSIDDLKQQWKIDTTFSANIAQQQREFLINGWQKAITATLSIAQ